MLLLTRRLLGLLLAVPALLGQAYAVEPPSNARDYLASIRPSGELQEFLDRTVETLAAADPKLRQVQVRIALLDMTRSDAPRLAQHNGETPIYPASVVKFVYLMAAYAWQEEGRLQIDSGLDELLTQMIHHSSNLATQAVFARLTGTEAGAPLSPDAYLLFRERRLAVDRWLQTLGITDFHCVNPTYNGDGDISGRDKQFLSDRSIPGGLPAHDGEFRNRNAMTAVGTVKLLALLATDRALSPEGSAAVRRRMRRDPVEQPYLAHRIVGGAARLPGLEVYSKSGTWGPDYADAGIIRDTAGREIVLAVFTEGRPPYRGDFIADLAYRCAAHLLSTPPAAAGSSSGSAR